jgi:hypothetical protein
MKPAYAFLYSTLFLVSPPVLANIGIQFDYTYDSGFFTGANSTRQALLNSAASVFETRFQDTLSAISSAGSNHFNAEFFNPGNGVYTTLNNYSVAADKIIVFVGAYGLGSGILGQGGPGGYSASGTVDFLNNAASRGQQGALATPATDFGPWGGSISFNNTSNFYFDNNTNVPSNAYDFYSVAIHELGHVLGFGTADSYYTYVHNGFFTGPSVVALTGSQAVTTDGHWANGVSYGGQEAAMTPDIAAGVRKQFTELDFAAMKDIGWQVSAVPEAETWGMMIAGLGLLGWRMRARHTA